MNILITGGTGFIGSALSQNLVEQGHDVIIKTRARALVKQPLNSIEDLNQIASDEVIDIIINLAGEPIANKRWSTKQKAKIITSRIGNTEQVIDLLKRLENKPELLISGSAIGVYGVAAGDEVVDESFAGDESFSSELCRQWENAASQANTLGVRTCLLRTGIVLGKGGGALAKMLPAFKFFLGGRIGSGQQWMPWIHIADMVGIINYCMVNKALSGAINCTSPTPVKNDEFSLQLAKSLNRPCKFHMPPIAIKLLMGQMGEELLLSGRNIQPIKLLDSDFAFQFTQLDDAFKQIIT